MDTLYGFTSKQKRFSTSVISRRRNTRCCTRNYDDDIAKENGVDAVINCLNILFKKDSTITKYLAL